MAASPTDLTGVDLDGADAPGPRRRLRQWVVVTVAVTALGLTAAHWVRSPQQIAAERQPPAPTVLTAAVDKRVLRATVTFRGQVGAAATFDVTPSPREGGRPVVTGVRAAVGQDVTPGSVLVEVAGRPVLALPGDVPAFRDLRPGATGKDVAQLQRALRQLGRRVDDPDGVFGTATKGAVRALYDGVGYPVPTDGDPTALTAAQQRVRTAERALRQAREPRSAPSIEDSSKSDGAGGGEAAPDPRAVGDAREDLDQARAALTEQERTTGPMVPLAEVVFLPSFPARLARSKAVVGGEVSAPLLTVDAGETLVRARIDPGQGGSVKAGMPVELYSEILGTGARGVVASVGELTPDPTSGARVHPVVIRGADGPLDPRFAGQDVRVAAETATSAGEQLVVPVSAVFGSADGGTTVLRARPDGDPEHITVTVGVSGNGYVAVTPQRGSLAPGDRVVVGTSHDAPAPS